MNRLSLRWVMAVALAAVLIVAVVSAASRQPVRAQQGLRSEATVSGTIRHEGLPVPGVTVQVLSGGTMQTVVTGASGTYDLHGVPIGTPVRLDVQPPIAARLEYRHWQSPSLAGDLTMDFDLDDGFRIEGQVFSPDGTPYTSHGLELRRIGASLPSGEVIDLGPIQTGRMDTMVAPGFYALLDLPDLSPPYAPPTIFDVRHSDAISQTVHLLGRTTGFPDEPPIAALISVGPPDNEGYAVVTGAAGAVPPLAAVMVVNQNASNLAVTASDVTGAFTTTTYAPPGSSLLIKYDPGGKLVTALWDRSLTSDKENAMNFQSLPGTSIRVGEGGWPSINLVGQLGWWAAWSLTGTMQTSGGNPSVLPGDTVTVTGRLVATSPAMSCTGTPTYVLQAGASLGSLFDENGRALPPGRWFASYLFTPTGLPIEHEVTMVQTEAGSQVQFSQPSCVTAHAFQVELTVTLHIPADLPTGTYQPVLGVTGDVPVDDTVPSIVVWHHELFQCALPLLRVGDAAPPHIPWVLLGDYAVNGLRGAAALEDQDSYAQPTRIRTAPDVLIIPRLDEQTGAPIRYHLEPGSVWLSSADRRAPPAPAVLLDLPGGELITEVQKPDGSMDTLGPAPILQWSIRTPSLPDGTQLAEGTGHIAETFHLATLDDQFAYGFAQYGLHTIRLYGSVPDVNGNVYPIQGTYQVMVARVLDLDPGELPTTPYEVGDAFAPGLHIYPAVPAEVTIDVAHHAYSSEDATQTYHQTGQANRFGYFQLAATDPDLVFAAPGEFRVDITARYQDPDGTLWAGATTWGGVVADDTALIEAHGRRGMDYKSTTVDDMPAWFLQSSLTPEKVGIENYYPYFSGDILWASEVPTLSGGDSLHTAITLRDLTGPSATIYNLLRTHYPQGRTGLRRPPTDGSSAGLEKRIAIGEAPVFIATNSGVDPVLDPSDTALWGYWYGSSERPDVHVREIISEDNLGTAYWRYNDTYGYQIGEPADGDQPGDIKWNLGGLVLRTASETNPVRQYAIYGSFWVLLPHDDPLGVRVTPPFQYAAGGLNGGPILTLLGREIDMLFLPRGVRPGDVLQTGDTVSLSGHVGPPLNSRVDVTITSPSGIAHTGSWHANKIGWLYDPAFDFAADETGRWTVDVLVTHDRPYLPTGLTPTSHNTGTVLGTSGRFEFYVVQPDSRRLDVSSPEAGLLDWAAPGTDNRIQPIPIRGVAPAGTSAIHYTIHDKGIVMGQGTILPDSAGAFELVYDPETLHETFSMLSLTAHEGRYAGLADEVTISLLAVGSGPPRANQVTLIGEQVFVRNDPVETRSVHLPLIVRRR